MLVAVALVVVVVRMLVTAALVIMLVRMLVAAALVVMLVVMLVRMLMHMAAGGADRFRFQLGKRRR